MELIHAESIFNLRLLAGLGGVFDFFFHNAFTKGNNLLKGNHVCHEEQD